MFHDIEGTDGGLEDPVCHDIVGTDNDPFFNFMPLLAGTRLVIYPSKFQRSQKFRRWFDKYIWCQPIQAPTFGGKARVRGGGRRECR